LARRDTTTSRRGRTPPVRRGTTSVLSSYPAFGDTRQTHRHRLPNG
jgi:hypothetical protein